MTTAALHFVCASAFVLYACQAPSEEVPPVDRTSPPGVTGSDIDVYKTAAGDEIHPLNLSKLEIAALVPSDKDGFTVRRGTGRADGTFTIPDVPLGTYYLRVGDEYFVTAARFMDLGGTNLGRPDAAPEETDFPTGVMLTVKGMSPWQAGDQLALFCANANVYIDAFEKHLEPIKAGATAFDRNLLLYPNNLNEMDEEKGDRAILYQFVADRTAGGDSYRALKRAATVPLTSDDGNFPEVTATLEEVPQQTLSLRWQRSEFERFQRAISPVPPAASSESFGLYARPSEYGAVPLLLKGPIPAGASDIDSGPLRFGNPFPASWPVMGYAFIASLIPFQLAGANPIGVNAYLRVNVDLAALAASPMRPLITPVRSPRIAGRDAFQAQQGVGRAPRLSWDAPEVGTAAGYRVTILQVYVEKDMRGDQTRAHQIATILTIEHGIIIPPGLLDVGESYLLIIKALSMPGVDFQARPKQGASPMGEADLVTAVFSP